MLILGFKKKIAMDLIRAQIKVPFAYPPAQPFQLIAGKGGAYGIVGVAKHEQVMRLGRQTIEGIEIEAEPARIALAGSVPSMAAA